MSGEQQAGAVDGGSGTASAPAIRVTGGAMPEQVAALVAVLSAAASSGDGGGRRPSRFRSTWAAHDHQMRQGLPHGRGAWRASARPF